MLHLINAPRRDVRAWLAALALLILGGCTLSPPAPSGDADSGGEVLRASASVRALTDSVADMVDGTGSSLTFRQGSALGDVQVGDIVASANPAAPFLRRVMDRVVTESGDVVLVTEDIALDEAFTDVDASRYAEFGAFIPADGVEVLGASTARVAPAGDQAAGREVPITSLDLSLKLSDGRAEGSAGVKLQLAALLELEAKGLLGGLQRAKVSLSGDYEFNIGLAFKAGEFMKKEFPLGRIPATFFFGPVPVYCEFDVAIEVTGAVTGAVVVEFKAHTEAGAEWTREGAWQRVFDHCPLTGSGKAQAQCGIQFLAVAKMTIYKIAGPKIAFGPYFNATLNSTQTCDLEFDTGLKAEVGVDFGEIFADTALAGRGLTYEEKREFAKGTLKLCNADKPRGPTFLQAELTTDHPPGVAITWVDNADNEVNFLVQFNDGGGWRDLGYLPKDATAFAHKTPSPGLDNLYQVFAVGPEGTLSDASNVAGVSIEAVAAPIAPAGLSAQADASDLVFLAWADASTNEAGFIIERAEGDGEFAELVQLDVDSTGFGDFAVKPESSYRYRVRTFNGAGLSEWSNVASVKTPLFSLDAVEPAPPSHLAAARTADNTAGLAWKDNSSREGGFIVERQEDGGLWTVIATLGANETSYADSTRKSGKKYAYRVRAFNLLGHSPYSNVAQADEENGGDGGPGGGAGGTTGGGGATDCPLVRYATYVHSETIRVVAGEVDETLGFLGQTARVPVCATQTVDVYNEAGALVDSFSVPFDKIDVPDGERTIVFISYQEASGLFVRVEYQTLEAVVLAE